MAQSSPTEVLERELDALREQLLDVGDDVTRQASHVLKMRQAFQIIFESFGFPVPDWLQDNPPPALQVIRGDGAPTSANQPQARLELIQP